MNYGSMHHDNKIAKFNHYCSIVIFTNIVIVFHLSEHEIREEGYNIPSNLRGLRKRSIFPGSKVKRRENSGGKCK